MRALRLFGIFVVACSTGSGFPDAGNPPTDATDEVPDLPGVDAGVEEEGPTCKNLECLIPDCTTTEGTTITGTVFAPNGTLPIFNVIVSVPNAPTTPFTDGMTCDHCGSLTSGSPLVVALTDTKGNFKLTNTPAGPNIPLVMQIGKWRREIKIPDVKPCVNNAISNKIGPVEDLTRLPKKSAEGDMPKIAMVTGGCDHLGCLMPKLGLDPTEYSAGPGSSATKPTTAISFYYGNSGGNPFGTTPPAQQLWNDYDQLKNFDMAILSCECSEANSGSSATKDQNSYDAMQKYMEGGGRILTTDMQYTWFKYSSDKNLNTSPWSWPGGAPSGTSPWTISQSFPKGTALADWLYYVSSISPYKTQTTQPPIKGEFPLQVPFDNILALDTKYGTGWGGSNSHPNMVSMNMPSAMTPDKQCGKGVHLDAHVGIGDQVNTSFPNACLTTANEIQLAAMFFIFDLSSCIQKDTAAVLPPKITQ